MYSLVRPLLFALEAETAHHFTLATLRAFDGLGLIPAAATAPDNCARSIMGIRFPNPVGLAAGLDKNGEYIDALGALGFGYLEIGTVTPRPQPGNPKPRMFRLPGADALINRMGFNNDGVARFVANVERSGYRGVLGINIGKNFDTPIERAADDYETCLNAVYAHASYVTVNVSSPNTAGLRDLQAGAALDALLSRLKRAQNRLAQAQGRYVPLVVKIAPDLDAAAVADIAHRLAAHRVDAVIATNTTLSRTDVATLPHASEAGGLSGAPLREQSNAVIRSLARALDGALPIIGVGGILSGADAREKIDAGATLVQLYTGLVYKGPDLVTECARALGTATAGTAASKAAGRR